MEEDKKRNKWTGTTIFKISIYLLVMLILGMMLFVLCLKSILQYNEWPIYTETNIVPQQEVRFPAMTVCLLSSGYKEDVLQIKAIFDKWFLCMINIRTIRKIMRH